MFDLEPNPFEQSFSRGSASTERTTPPRGGDATSVKHNALPPLSSLTSPAAADPSQFPWLAGHSLRSGPLSPAMLAGPQQNSQNNNNSNNNAAAAPPNNGATNTNAPASNNAANNGNNNPPPPNPNAGAWGPAGEGGAVEGENFEPGNFRTGFTPGTGSGFTPGYNALLNSNFGQLPMPSPNTAAFLNSITNVATDGVDSNGAPAGGQGGAYAEPPSAIPPHMQQQQQQHMPQLNPGMPGGPQETITPNTLNALTGAVGEINRQQGGIPQQPYYPPGMVPQVDYAQQNANAASQAANGLFLLSQAHQELSKREREESQGPLMNKRTAVGAAPPGSGKPPSAGQKRKEAAPKGPAAKKGKKGPGPKEESESDEEEEDFDDKKLGRNETEEEKRKNFLERNRQGELTRNDSTVGLSANKTAALKCRQRKKAWLNELQNKVETLSMENERLQHTVRSMEDELQRLTTILMQHRDCGLAMPPMAPAYGRPLR